MNRTVAWMAGLGLAVLAAGAPAAAAAGQDEAGPKRRVERRVLLHQGGAFLGVGLAEVEGGGRGAAVRSVEEGSPAAKAGLKEGDVIVRFDGEAVRSSAHLRRLIGETPAGRLVGIEVTRGGATQKLDVTLGSRRGARFGSGLPELEFTPEPPDAPEPPEAPEPPLHGEFLWKSGDDVLTHLLPGWGGPPRLGVEYIEMGEQLAAAYELRAKNGVLVVSVDEAGPAAKAGMKAGDVILKFDGKAVEDGGDLRDAVAAAGGGKPVTVAVQRKGAGLDLQVTLAEPRKKSRRSAGRML